MAQIMCDCCDNAPATHRVIFTIIPAGKPAHDVFFACEEHALDARDNAGARIAPMSP